MAPDARDALCAVKTALERLGDACADAYAALSETLGADDLPTDYYDPTYDPGDIDFGDPDAW